MGSSHEFSLDYLVSQEVKKSPEFKSVKKEKNALLQELRKLSSQKFSKEVKERRSDIFKMTKELNKDMDNIRRNIIFSILDTVQVVFSTQTSCLDKNLEN